MILKQVYILSCLVILLSAATINAPSELKRQKRTIQYFFDGLLSAFKERRPLTARTINDHRASTLISLAKLSSGSTPIRNVQTFDDDNDQSIIENTLNLSHDNLPSLIQMPIPSIPSIASTLLQSTENRIPQSTMTKRVVEMDVQMINQSSKNVSQVEQTVTQTTTIAPKQTPATTAVPSQTQSNDLITLNQTQTTTTAPNHTGTTTTTTTTTTTAMTTTTEEPNQNDSVESQTTTIKPDNSTDSFDLTTLNPLESDVFDSKNLSPNVDDTQTKMEKRNAPMKASDLHTTQFFGGPLVVEGDRSDKHKPIYLDDCIEINCNQNINAIQSRTLSDSRIAPIISMTIALPATTSNIDLRRQNSQSPIQNYNVFTLHTHIPIYTEVNSKRLSNEIIDPPTARIAH